MLDRLLRMEAPLKILAVDDTRSVTLSMGFVFAKPRYEFSWIDNGMDALAVLKGDCAPDVIIVDHEMPNLTGLEFVREIRKRGISSEVIVVAAVLPSETRQAYEQMDVHVMFDKPFDISQLRSAVDHIVA